MTFTDETFSEFMDEALYGTDGFYTLGGGAGRSRDYLTSVEIGDLFGRVISSYIDKWYDELETDQPAIVIDAGCGPGSLAASIARAPMKNAEKINYCLVDRSRAHLETAQERMSKMTVHFSWSIHGTLPECEFPTLVIANELLDNLVFNIAFADEVYKEFKPEEIDHATLDIDTYAFLGVFKNIDNLKDADVPRDIGHFRIPQHVGIAKWFQELSIVTSNISSLTLLLIDYMKGVAEFEDGTWLRLYSDNDRIVGVNNVSEALNSGIRGDITTDVIKEDLHVLLDIEGFSKVKFVSQAQWLVDNGIDIWCQNMPPSESGYDKLESWINTESSDNVSQDFSSERNILTDDFGLGAFTVVEARRET